jgi:hypothetical protein
VNGTVAGGEREEEEKEEKKGESGEHVGAGNGVEGRNGEEASGG